MEKLAIRACTDLIHDRRFQVHLPLSALSDIECMVDAQAPCITCVDTAASRLKRKHSEKVMAKQPSRSVARACPPRSR